MCKLHLVISCITEELVFLASQYILQIHISRNHRIMFKNMNWKRCEKVIYTIPLVGPARFVAF